jgi:transcriptional regulator with XRE-family HTH domain
VELADAELAQKLYDLRIKYGLTQRLLAKLVGTTASVICRLEDADYEGHSLAMLRRIAAALGKRVDIGFLPFRREAVQVVHRNPANRASLLSSSVPDIRAPCRYSPMRSHRSPSVSGHLPLTPIQHKSLDCLPSAAL